MDICSTDQVDPEKYFDEKYFGGKPGSGRLTDQVNPSENYFAEKCFAEKLYEDQFNREKYFAGKPESVHLFD